MLPYLIKSIIIIIIFKRNDFCRWAFCLAVKQLVRMSAFHIRALTPLMIPPANAHSEPWQMMTQGATFLPPVERSG